MTRSLADLLGMTTSKTCSRCGQDKPLTDFYRRSDRDRERFPDDDPRAYRGACKECFSPASTPERRAKAAEYQRRYREKNPETLWAKHLRNYGVTPEWYAETLASQGGGCAICNTPECSTGRRFAIDHDHRCCPDPATSCGKCVRGLLCSSCNVGIGKLGDDATRLQAAAAYLRRTHRDSSTDRAPGTGP